MKKLFLLLILTYLLTGCDSKLTTVTNPNGDSKIYQFFIQEDYTPEAYTLKLKQNNTKITIINDQNRNYYYSKDQTTTKVIEQENNKYTIDSSTKSYTVEPITTLDNYGLGYLPQNMEKLKKQSYKTGTKWEGLTRYVIEIYEYASGTTTYYFKGDNLKYIENKTALSENRVEFISISSKIDDKKFNLPKNYQEITY